MPITENSVLQALRPVVNPASKASIVDEGIVSNIKIGGGNVSFDLVAPRLPPPVQDQLRMQCLQAVKALEGVGHVSVNLAMQSRGPAAQQRRKLQSVRNIVAVASGKGGVGKSTTAVNLAVALQQTGARVGILDADIYGPSVPTMIRISQMPRPLEDNIIEPGVGLGVKIVSMAFFMGADQAAILRGPMVSGYVNQFIDRVNWGDLDYLIIDYPPGTGDIQLTLSQQAPISGAVITTTPQDISLVDVRRAVAMFEKTEVPVLGVCENMSYFICDECGKRHDIFRSGGGERISTKLGVPLLAQVPMEVGVAKGGDEGKPVVEVAPNSGAGKAYRQLAEAVVEQLDLLNAGRGQYLESFSLEWSQY